MSSGKLHEYTRLCNRANSVWKLVDLPCEKYRCKQFKGDEKSIGYNKEQKELDHFLKNANIRRVIRVDGRRPVTRSYIESKTKVKVAEEQVPPIQNMLNRVREGKYGS
jgi:hypothetical protein